MTDDPNEVVLRSPEQLDAPMLRAGIAVVGYCAVGIGMLLEWLSSSGPGRAVEFTLAAAAVAGTVIGWLVHRKKGHIRVRREGNVVIGLNRPLEIGDGLVRVRAVQTMRMNQEPARIVYDVAHVSQRPERATSLQSMLFVNCRDPVRTRTAVETLCRFGNWRMAWAGFDDLEPQVRPPESLDEPLTHLARDLARLEVARPDGLRWKLARKGGTGLVLRSATLAKGPGIAKAVVLALTSCLLGFCFQGFAPRFGLGLALLGAPAGLGLALALSLRRLEIEGSREGVRQWVRLFGLRLGGRMTPARLIEGIHYEVRFDVSSPVHHLALAGDGFYRLMGQFRSYDEANFVRHALLCALLGELPRTLFEPASPERAPALREG